MQIDASGESIPQRSSADSSFGQRRKGYSASKHTNPDVDMTEGGAEISWIPSSDNKAEQTKGRKRGEGEGKGFTLERGAAAHKGDKRTISESERKGRTKRRTDLRSGSRNTFRRM
jgi:ribosome biogenesis protein ENP2